MNALYCIDKYILLFSCFTTFYLNIGSYLQHIFFYYVVVIFLFTFYKTQFKYSFICFFIKNKVNNFILQM